MVAHSDKSYALVMIKMICFPNSCVFIVGQLTTITGNELLRPSDDELSEVMKEDQFLGEEQDLARAIA